MDMDLSPKPGPGCVDQASEVMNEVTELQTTLDTLGESLGVLEDKLNLILAVEPPAAILPDKQAEAAPDLVPLASNLRAANIKATGAVRFVNRIARRIRL